MVLWLIFAALTAITLLAVLWPILRNRGAANAGDLVYDAAIFKDQLDEIDAERDSGLLSDAEAESARNEISRRLLAAADNAPEAGTVAPSSKTSAPVVALVTAFLFLPVTSAGLYLVYGSPSLPDQPLAARLSSPTEDNDIQTAIAKVEARLREHPEDGRGWAVIAPVYMRQQRFQQAADAYGKAIRLLGQSPQRLSEYGHAIVMANDGVVSERARSVLARAVSFQPTLFRARYWLAVAHEQDGSSELALKAWRDLLQESPDNAPWRDAVKQRVIELAQATGAEAPFLQAQPKAKPEQSDQPGPTQEEVEAAREMSASDRATMIEQMVAGLAERLKENGGTVDEWNRLLRSYMVLGKRDEAAGALADARKALADNPSSLEQLDAFARQLGIAGNQ